MKRILFGWIFIGFFIFPSNGEALTKYPFEGEIDFTRMKMDVSVKVAENSSVAIHARKSAPAQIAATLKVDHLKTRIFDISSEVETSVDLSAYLKDNAQPIRGKVWSQYTIINFQPISELKGNFEINDGRFSIGPLSYGHFGLDGYVDLKAPYHLDFLIKLNGLEMADFLDFWMTERKFSTSGQVSGTIRASGELKKLFLKGQLETFHGFIKKLSYESFYLNAEGYFPNIQVADSKITEEGGLSYTIDGQINLADHKNFKKQIKELNVLPIVSGSGDKLEWTIRSSKDNTPGTSTQIKYLLRKDETTTGSTTEQDKGLLGVQKSLEF